MVFPCSDCKNNYFAHELSLKDVLISSTKILDRNRKQVLVSGSISETSTQRYHLSIQLKYFMELDSFKTEFPLEKLHRSGASEKIETLAFAYASIYRLLLGNFTLVEHSVEGLQRTIRMLTSDELDLFRNFGMIFNYDIT